MIDVAFPTPKSDWIVFCQVDLLMHAVLLMILLLGALTVPHTNVSQVMILCTVCASMVIVAATVAASYTLLQHVRSKFRKKFAFFLCHHKAAASGFARLLKMELKSRGSQFTAFIDSDNLTDLAQLFSFVANDAETLVLIGTEGRSEAKVVHRRGGDCQIGPNGDRDAVFPRLSIARRNCHQGLQDSCAEHCGPRCIRHWSLGHSRHSSVVIRGQKGWDWLKLLHATVHWCCEPTQQHIGHGESAKAGRLYYSCRSWQHWGYGNCNGACTLYGQDHSRARMSNSAHICWGHHPGRCENYPAVHTAMFAIPTHLTLASASTICEPVQDLASGSRWHFPDSKAGEGGSGPIGLSPGARGHFFWKWPVLSFLHILPT